MGPVVSRMRTILRISSAFLSLFPLFGQTAFTGRCQVTSTPLQVRAEGVTERLGDIGLECTGGTPGSLLSANLTLFLPVAVTNRIDANFQAVDSLLAIDTGSGFAASAVRAQISGNTVGFYGLSAVVPTGNLNLRVSGLRAAVSQLGGLGQPLNVSISSSLALNQAQAVVAYPQTGLTATLYSTGIACYGSPAPGAFTLADLFAAGTAFASTRLTEGYSSAFEPRQPGADNGVRFLVRYSGFPASARIYIPDAVAGSNTVSPTSAGDLGLPQSLGRYLPGSHTLVLVRVNGADSTGAGGFTVFPPQGSGAQTLNSVSEVTLTNGSGYAVYEVADANPGVQESAQFPTFITLPNVTAPATATATETVTLAPVSGAFAASATAPIARFVSSTPPSDCSLLEDCNAGYFPKLMADGTPIQISAVANGGPMTSNTGYITVRNASGGLLVWNVVIRYETGADWLFVDNAAGAGNASVRVWSDTKTLGPGTYHATITINAGSAGSQTIPLTLTVTAPTPPPPPPPTAPVPTVTQVVNAATFQPTPLVAGSLATVMGAHLAGKSVQAAFDGVAASILYSSDSQVNLQVPVALTSKTSAVLVLTIDGAATAARNVALVPAAPSIFAHGVLNQDYSDNGAAAARPGDVLQIFLTGLPKGALVTGQIGTRTGLIPLYAAEAPDVPGVQQVNLAIPANASNADQLILCATPAGGSTYCSAPYSLNIR